MASGSGCMTHVLRPADTVMTIPQPTLGIQCSSIHHINSTVRRAPVSLVYSFSGRFIVTTRLKPSAGLSRRRGERRVSYETAKRDTKRGKENTEKNTHTVRRLQWTTQIHILWRSFSSRQYLMSSEFRYSYRHKAHTRLGRDLTSQV